MTENEWPRERKEKVREAIRLLLPSLELFRDHLAADDTMRHELEVVRGWVVEADEYAREGHFADALYWLTVSLSKAWRISQRAMRKYLESELLSEPSATEGE